MVSLSGSLTVCAVGIFLAGFAALVADKLEKDAVNTQRWRNSLLYTNTSSAAPSANAIRESTKIDSSFIAETVLRDGAEVSLDPRIDQDTVTYITTSSPTDLSHVSEPVSDDGAEVPLESRIEQDTVKTTSHTPITNAPISAGDLVRRHCLTGSRVPMCAFDDVVSQDLLPKLQKEVDLLEPFENKGTRWFALKATPRMAVESLIGNVIAPIALGDLYSEFIGGDWWVQSRTTSSAKEYHADTDTQNCHDSSETNCHAADVATVFYLDGNGGPTVVFNQSFNANGLVPRMPTGVGLADPLPARLLVFQGNLYHGVLRSYGKQRRTTLLVNFWRARPDEGQDWNPVPRSRWAVVKPHAPKRVTGDSILFRVPFDIALQDWQNQILPPWVADAIKKKRKKRGRASPALVWLRFQESKVNEQMSPDMRIPTWLYWADARADGT